LSHYERSGFRRKAADEAEHAVVRKEAWGAGFWHGEKQTSEALPQTIEVGGSAGVIVRAGSSS
jgi:hypothetical protein